MLPPRPRGIGSKPGSSAGKTRAVQSASPLRDIDAVIFDLGGVIMRNGKPSDMTKRFPHADIKKVTEIIMGPHHLDGDHPWHRLERGEISMAECRALQREMLEAAGIAPAVPPPSSSGVASPSNSSAPAFQFELEPRMIELVDDLRASGVKIGILTNNVREFREWWWSLMDFEATFHTVVDSHEVGMRKPNPAIYHLTMDRLGATAARTAFLDDIQANVDAATSIGMHGIKVDDDPTSAIAHTRHLAKL